MAFNNVGALTVSLLGDINSASKGLDAMSKKVKVFGDKVEAVGKRVGKVGKTMTLGITLPLVAFGAAAVKFASDAEEIQSKFEAVFKETAGDVEEWIASFSDSVKRNATDLKEYAATFQDTFVPLGFVREDAAELSKKLVELTIDLASFNNASEPETMKALQSAIVGNHETVRRFGVIINQAGLEQELFNMGITAGMEAATEAEKAQARLNLIIAGTADAQGDATKTAGSFANMMKGLKSQLKAVSEEIGNFLIPYIKDIVEKIQDWLQAWKDLKVEERARIIKTVLVVGALGPLLVILGKILVIMPKLAAAMSLLAGHPILVAIGLITTAFLTLYNTIDEFRYFWDDVWVGIVNIGKTAANAVNAVINGIIDGINLLSKAISFIPGIKIPEIEKLASIDLTNAVTEFDKIRAALDQVNRAVGDIPTEETIAEWKRLTDAIVEQYEDAFPEIQAIQEQALEDLESGVATSITNVTNEVRRALEKSAKAAIDILALTTETAEEIVEASETELGRLITQFGIELRLAESIISPAFTTLNNQFADLLDRIEATVEGTTSYKSAMKDLAALQIRVGDAIAEAGDKASASLLLLKIRIEEELEAVKEMLFDFDTEWTDYWAGVGEHLADALGTMLNRWGDFRKTQEAEEAEHLAAMYKIRENATGMTAKEQKAAFDAEKTRYEEQKTTRRSILGDMVRDLLEALRTELLVKAASHLVEAIGLAFIPGMQLLAAGHAQAAVAYGVGGATLAAAGFEEGGVVPGPPGAPMIIMAHGKERVLTEEQQLIDYTMIGKAVAAGTYDAMKEVLGQDSGRPVILQVGDTELARVMYPALLREGQRLGVTA